MPHRSKLVVKFFCFSVAAEGALGVCASVAIVLAVLLFSQLVTGRRTSAYKIIQPVVLLALELTNNLDN